MATAGETSHQGGVGGKIQKNHNRTDSNKPYNRPSWIPKFVVDPASRITERAQKLLSFALRKNLPTLPTISEANHDSRDAFPEAPCVSQNPSGDQEQVSREIYNLNNNSDSGAINDLEQILKQKTFTIAEIDHLTELLRSRTSDVSAEDEKGRLETSTSQLVEAPGRKGSLPVQENEVKNQTLLGTLSFPLSCSSLLEEEVVSPSELAKRYMGSRHSKTSPLTLSFRNQTFREDVLLRTSLPFSPKPHSRSLVPRTAVPYASVPRGPEDGYLTPVPRGRSAIYSTARTPYSRIHHTAMLKGVGPMTEEKTATLTSSQWSWENNILSGGKQASKRRSSVLDSDIGSIGHIRRVRRKTNMMYSSEHTGLSIPGVSLSTPLNSIGTNTAKGPISSIQKEFQVDVRKHNTSARGIMKNGESSIASRRFVCVPNKSHETAQKILQQLDKFVPSPKGKSCELKTTTGMGISPSKLTPGMLHGQTRKSLEGADLSKLPHNAHANGILAGSGDNHGTSARDLTSQKKTRVDENGSATVSISEDKLGPEANGVVTTRSSKDARSLFQTANAVISCPVANAPQKKQACEKNANKDSLELDGNNFGSRVGSNPLVARKGKHDKPMVKSKEIADGATTVGGPLGSFSDLSTPGSVVLKKSSATGASDNHPASAKSIGLTYSVPNATSTVVKPAPSTSLSPSSFNRTFSPNEPTCVQGSFASRTVDKGTPFTFSSASVACEFSGLNGTRQEVKLETVSSRCTTTTSPNVSPMNTSVFQFGSSTSVSAAPSDLASRPPATSGIECTDPELKTNCVSTFGNLNNSTFGTKTSAFTGSSSSTFVFGASASLSANVSSFNNQFQSSHTSQTFGLSEPSPVGSGGSVTFGSTVSETGFKFGSSSSSSSSSSASFTIGSASTAFRSSLGTPAGSIFSFTSATATSGPLCSLRPGNDQMNIEDNMTEHTAQASTPMIQDFGQLPSVPQQSNLTFGAPSSSGPDMFLFKSQQDPTTSQNQPLVQSPGGLGFSTGGKSVLSTGSSDKSNHRYIKVRKSRKS